MQKIKPGLTVAFSGWAEQALAPLVWKLDPHPAQEKPDESIKQALQSEFQGITVCLGGRWLPAGRKYPIPFKVILIGQLPLFLNSSAMPAWCIIRVPGDAPRLWHTALAGSATALRFVLGRYVNTPTEKLPMTSPE